MYNKELWGGLTVVFAILFIICTAATSFMFSWDGVINDALGIQTVEIVSANEDDSSTLYYPSEFGDGTVSEENEQALLAASHEQGYNELAEGAVLLKNDGALPLEEGERKITVFGNNAVNFAYMASNGSANKPGSLSDNYAAFDGSLQAAGFEINPVLWDAYRNSGAERIFQDSVEKCDIGEAPRSLYTSEIVDSFDDYSDAAIVVITREAGEGYDVYAEDYEGISGLAIHRNERDMLEVINASGAFDKVIVLLNMTNQMELDWLEEYGVDACLWIGYPGQWGMEAVADILTGAVNPSGRLPDTWAANSLSAPAVVNSGTQTPKFANREEMGGKIDDQPDYYSYVSVQTENIYIGYKYYETRYEDLILGRGGADGAAGASFGSSSWNYADEMCYTFGHGLSYSEFSQSLDAVSKDNGTYTLTVTVENTGDRAGKDVVQVYAQTPYGEYERENGVEKSAVVLVAFAKTDLLAPGESQTLTIGFDEYFLASYDGNGAKTYILSEGDYYLAIGADAHDALNNILAAKGAEGMVDAFGMSVAGDASKTYSWQQAFDAETYSVSRYTGNEISNLFDECDINYFYDADVAVYLTRADWDGTYPRRQVAPAATEEMMRQLNGVFYEKPSDAPALSDFTIGDKSAKIKLLDLLGKSYDDPLWERYLDQYSVGELTESLIDAQGSMAVAFAGVNRGKIKDGPTGLTETLPFSGEPCTCYAAKPILTATFNTQLYRRRGELMGEDCIFTKVMATLGIGGNLHRTPFGGRSMDYMTEDANLAYLAGRSEALGLRSKGVSGAIKHFTANDQEFNRKGLAVFFTEQSFRENALRAFEGVLTGDASYACMLSFNRVGCYASYESQALLTGLARGEWGYQGYFQTDASLFYSKNHADILAAGTDLFTAGSKSIPSILESAIAKEGDGFLYQKARDAVKRIHYCLLNSNVINGQSVNDEIIEHTPWWKYAAVSISAVFGVLCAASAVMLILTMTGVLKKRKEAEK